jgi:hypothetical protein
MRSATITRISTRDAAGLVADVLAPLLARGVILRRRRIESLLDRVDADGRAVRRMQQIRSTRSRIWTRPGSRTSAPDRT